MSRDYRILLVDDESIVHETVGEFLAECGYEITSAKDGSEALAALDRPTDFDLIVSDVRMPKMDGVEFLKTCRVRFPGIPVMLMTGHGDEGVAISALQGGALDYIKKPVHLEDLVGRIEELEERRLLEAQTVADYQTRVRPASGTAPVGEAPDGVASDRGLSRTGSTDASVLLVEPDPDVRESTKSALIGAGYRVKAVGSCEEALAAFSDAAFDLVMTEVDLGGSDGLDLIREARALDPVVGAIVVTSRTDQQTAVRALEAGAQSFIIKPSAEQDLQSRLGKVLCERKRLVDARLLLGDLMRSRSDLRQKVVERERFLKHLIDAAPHGIVSTDRQGQVLTVNGAALEMYGRQERQIVGSHLSTLFEDEAPREADPDSGDSFRSTHAGQDGGKFPVLVRVSQIGNGQDRCVGWLYVIEDLTERDRMESQLLSAERLSTLGQLVPRVAHELKTPLQAILGHTELGLMALESGNVEAVKQSLQKILPAEEQILSLVQQMFRLGRPEEIREEVLDPAAEVDKALDTLSHLGVLKFIDVEREFDPGVGRIAGDPVQMEQVLRNLIVNAAHAMEGQHPCVLTVGLRPSDDGSRVEVTVTDTGGASRQRTPIAKTIVDRYGGRIEFDSRQGEGTRFLLSFPAV